MLRALVFLCNCVLALVASGLIVRRDHCRATATVAVFASAWAIAASGLSGLADLQCAIKQSGGLALLGFVFSSIHYHGFVLCCFLGLVFNVQSWFRFRLVLGGNRQNFDFDVNFELGSGLNVKF